MKPFKLKLKTGKVGAFYLAEGVYTSTQLESLMHDSYQRILETAESMGLPPSTSFDRIGMNDDRELLELAAKAAGISLCRWLDHCGYLAEGDDIWNPLTDDGDAFRLAVKLGLTISIHREDINVWSDHILEITEINAVGPRVATRRAIVRFAATIGKEMK